MTIETTQLDRIPTTIESPLETAKWSPLASGSAASAAPSLAAVSTSEVAAAVQQLKTAIGGGANPAFSVDYLSGLSVVTVRSNTTGEVVFQLPDTRAVALARLIGDGASLGSLGLLDMTA